MGLGHKFFVQNRFFSRCAVTPSEILSSHCVHVLQIFGQSCLNLKVMLKKQGLYSPEFEHDNCGAGFICSLTGKRSNDIIHKALEILVKLEHL